MIARFSFRYLAILLFLIDFVRCGCKNHLSKNNNTTSNSHLTNISSSALLPSSPPLPSSPSLPPSSSLSPPTPSPITQDMIDAIKIAPGLQELLRQLQAGGNVDFNKPIDSNVDPSSNLPANDLPLNLVYIVLIRPGTSVNAGYTQARLDIIENLLSKGAKPNPLINTGSSSHKPKPLLISIINAERLDVLELLLKYNDETFTKKHNGRTPYAYAKAFLSPPKQTQFLQAFEAAGINS